MIWNSLGISLSAYPLFISEKEEPPPNKVDIKYKSELIFLDQPTQRNYQVNKESKFIFFLSFGKDQMKLKGKLKIDHGKKQMVDMNWKGQQSYFSLPNEIYHLF